MENKKSWFKPAIESKGTACMCCGAISEVLALDTQLFFGSVGGWTVTKDGQHFAFEKKDFDEEGIPTLQDIENMIGDDQESEYIASYDSPLMDALYQRHAKNSWVLIKQGIGYA